MSREKQIDEMAKIMCGFDDDECEHCNTCSFHNGCACEIDAENLYNAGYRKASEVAREIFEEIEEMLNLQAKIVCETRDKYRETDQPMLSFIAMLDGRIYSLRVIEEHISELKKKYTEDT